MSVRVNVFKKEGWHLLHEVFPFSHFFLSLSVHYVFFSCRISSVFPRGPTSLHGSTCRNLPSFSITERGLVSSPNECRNLLCHRGKPCSPSLRILNYLSPRDSNPEERTLRLMKETSTMYREKFNGVPLTPNPLTTFFFFMEPNPTEDLRNIKIENVNPDTT